MSRSYKKTSYSGDTNDKAYKKVSNKRIRSYPEIPDGSFFKKLMCSWFIKDYCSYMTEKEFMADWYDPESYMRKLWPTYEEAVQNYMKYYRRK